METKDEIVPDLPEVKEVEKVVNYVMDSTEVSFLTRKIGRKK